MTVLKQKAKKSGRKKNPPKGDRTREAVGQYAGDAYDLAKRTWRGLNEIRKFINIEEKFSDTSVNLNPDQSGSLTCVTQLAQGTTMNTRVGNSIKVQRLEILGRVAANSSITTFSVVRVMVVRDMEGQGSAPAVSDILETVGTSAAPRSPHDWLNRKRFAIVHDELIVLSANSGGNMAQTFTFKQNLERHVLYRGTSAAAASDGEGSIYVVAVSDEATNTPSVGLVARIIYTDD